MLRNYLKPNVRNIARKKLCTLIDLILLFLFSFGKSFSQDIPYGNNPAAGHYIDVDGTKIYYEIYGKGKPFPSAKTFYLQNKPLIFLNKVLRLILSLAFK